MQSYRSLLITIEFTVNKKQRKYLNYTTDFVRSLVMMS